MEKRLPEDFDSGKELQEAREERLRHFHIHDGLGRKNHMTLGTGEIDLKQRLQIAKECGCRCVVETKTADALRKSMDWLAVHKDNQLQVKCLCKQGTKSR